MSMVLFERFPWHGAPRTPDLCVLAMEMIRAFFSTDRAGTIWALAGLFCISSNVQGQCGTTITSFPYTEGFESAPAWTSGGVASDWTWGTPAHPLINAAGEGTKSWCVGGLTGSFYNSNERSWLESPCFDFSALANPRISFKIFWEVERQYDGLTFQYSTDGGTTYGNVGAFGDSPDCNTENWFNSPAITNLPVTINPKHGWSGRVGASQGSCMGGSGSQTWVTAKHCLAWLAFEPSVRFRFFFGAGSTCNNYDGVAIDDIVIGQADAVTAAFAGDCNGTTVDFINSSSPCPNSYEWDFGEPGSPQNISTFEAPSHDYAAPGTYPVTLTITDACGAMSAITQLISVLGVDINVVQPSCGQNNGTLQAMASGTTEPVSYYWSPGGATTQSLTNAGPGTYTVTVTSANGCPATATATLLNSVGNLAVDVDHTDISCQGLANGTATAVVAGGVMPTSLEWSPSGSQTPAVTGLGPGWVTCTVTDGDGCVAADSALVLEPLPVSISVPADTAICSGQSVLLQAVATGGAGDYTMAWFPEGPSAAPLVTTMYSVVATDAQGCSSLADSVLVSVATAFEPVITATDSTGCTPLCISFSAWPLGAVAYSWDFGDGALADTAAPDHCFTAGGSYTVSLTVTDTVGCIGTVTIPGLVQATASPTVSFRADPPVTTLDNPTILFINTSVDADSFIWHFGDALNSVSVDEFPMFSFDSVACYTVTLEAANAAGCSASGQGMVCVEDLYALYMPNAFTPNGDGINDLLHPVTTVRAPGTYRFMVHDRWGTPCFTTDDPQVGWSGAEAHDGVYIWSVWLTDALGDPREHRGHVLLVR